MFLKQSGINDFLGGLSNKVKMSCRRGQLNKPGQQDSMKDRWDCFSLWIIMESKIRALNRMHSCPAGPKNRSSRTQWRLRKPHKSLAQQKIKYMKILRNSLRIISRFYLQYSSLMSKSLLNLILRILAKPSFILIRR